MQRKHENSKCQWKHWPLFLMRESVTTLTLGLRLNVECEGPQGQEIVFGCETHFHKWGRVQRMKPMTPKCTPTFGVALVRESWMFIALVRKVNKHQIGTLGYHWKVLEVWMPQVPSHCSFRYDMHELWSKEGMGIKLWIWFPTTNPLRVRIEWSPIRACNTLLERSFWGL